MPNAKIVITDNHYRLYVCLLNADNFVLKMKKCPDTVTMHLLEANMVSLEEEHATKSMQGLSSVCGNTFFQIVTLTDLSLRCPESQSEAGS